MTHSTTLFNIAVLKVLSQYLLRIDDGCGAVSVVVSQAKYNNTISMVEGMAPAEKAAAAIRSLHSR